MHYSIIGLKISHSKCQPLTTRARKTALAKLFHQFGDITKLSSSRNRGNRHRKIQFLGLKKKVVLSKLYLSVGLAKSQLTTTLHAVMRVPQMSKFPCSKSRPKRHSTISNTIIILPTHEISKPLNFHTTRASDCDKIILQYQSLTLISRTGSVRVPQEFSGSVCVDGLFLIIISLFSLVQRSRR